MQQPLLSFKISIFLTPASHSKNNPFPPAEMSERIAEVTSASLPWLIVEQDDSIPGYAHASKWKGRSAYGFSVETTIYPGPDCSGRGIGTSLYQLLLKQLKELGFHVVILGESLSPMLSVWPCMRNSVFAKSRSSLKSVSNLANGSMSAIGN
jgi:hypothetical protein